jgi:hypothetical protein
MKSSPLENAKLQFQTNPGDAPVKIKTERSRPNSATNYIRSLLAEGFRGNSNYYRDSDKRLILKVWEHEGLVLTKEQRELFLHKVTFPDSITRARREMRAEFPESPEVEKKRFKLFIETRDKYSKGGIFKRFARDKA